MLSPIRLKGLDLVVQRVNADVFPMPDQIMENIDRVTRHV
jgi:hypothetical protein